MFRGLPASIMLHLAVLGTGYIALPYGERVTQDVVIVPIDLVTVSEINNIAPVIARPEPETPVPEEAELPEPEPDLEDFLEDVDSVPEEIAPVEEDIIPPPPEEAPPESVEDTITEEPEPEEKEPEPEPEEPEPTKIRKTDALDDLLADDPFARETPDLLDLAQKERPKAPPPKVPEVERRTDTPAPAAEAIPGAGERTAQEARVESLLWQQMSVCWEAVSDLPDPERLDVKLVVDLNRDGTLSGDARLLSPRRVPIGDRFMGQAVDRALRAARRCQPYRLPEADYDVWQEITMNFRHDR